MYEAAQFSPSIFKHRTSFVRCNFPQRSIFQDALRMSPKPLGVGVAACPQGTKQHLKEQAKDRSILEHAFDNAATAITRCNLFRRTIPRGKRCTRHGSERSPPRPPCRSGGGRRSVKACESAVSAPSDLHDAPRPAEPLEEA